MEPKTHQELLKENQYFENLLKKSSFQHNGKTFVLQPEHNGATCGTERFDAEIIQKKFEQHFKKSFSKTPEGKEVQQWRHTYCQVFQAIFHCCRSELIKILVEPLYSLPECSKDHDIQSQIYHTRSRPDEHADVRTAYRYLQRYSLQRLQEIFVESLCSLTELSETEHLTSQIFYTKSDELADVRAAYGHLLKHQGSSLRLSQSVTDKIMSSVAVYIDETTLSSQAIQEQLLEAIDTCWKMLQLPTPMFVCQPKVLKEQGWHEIYRTFWDYNAQNYELVYYRPVLMYGAGGNVACKGLVGSRRTTDTNESVLSKLGSGLPNKAAEVRKVKEQEALCKGCQCRFKTQQLVNHYCQTCISKQSQLQHDTNYSRPCFRCKVNEAKLQNSETLRFCEKCVELTKKGKCFECEKDIENIKEAITFGKPPEIIFVCHINCVLCIYCGKDMTKSSIKCSGKSQYFHPECIN